MNKLARILLVEPEDDLRRDLNWHLERAGHEVACVLDSDGAWRLIRDGLQPDVVVAEAVRPEEGRPLREVVPNAAHLRIVRGEEKQLAPNEIPDDPTRCTTDPGDILRRIEEVLMSFDPRVARDEAGRCMDLARRLANSLPRSRTANERVDLVTDGFDAFFGVIGTLMVRRGPEEDDWIEVRQGLSAELANRISEEICRRTQVRGLRPFMTPVELDGEIHQIACVAVQVGSVETDLALALRDAPEEPQNRESLMNLMGGSMRASMSEEQAAETRELLEAQVSSFESLLSMSREFTATSNRRGLCLSILHALHRELQMSRAALFLSRDEGRGMLDLQAANGFPEVLLQRIGLSGFHGVGAECLESEGARRLNTFAAEGAATRELELLAEAKLRWAVPFKLGSRPLGVLLFGCSEDSDSYLDFDDLGAAQHQVLHALLEAASVALQNLERLEGLQDLSIRTLKGLVSAVELRCPKDRGHAERVTRSTVKVGRAMGLSPAEMRDLAFCALLHDVGKLGVTDVPDDDDVKRQRSHPVIGSRILSRAKPTASVIQAVEQHHERWDGLGFPYGLKAEGIQLYARLIAIANAYDHMITGPALGVPRDEALRRLERGAGLLWDPGLVAMFTSQVGRGPVSEDDHDTWLEEILSAT